MWLTEYQTRYKSYLFYSLQSVNLVKQTNISQYRNQLLPTPSFIKKSCWYFFKFNKNDVQHIHITLQLYCLENHQPTLKGFNFVYAANFWLCSVHWCRSQPYFAFWCMGTSLCVIEDQASKLKGCIFDSWLCCCTLYCIYPLRGENSCSQPYICSTVLKLVWYSTHISCTHWATTHPQLI